MPNWFEQLYGLNSFDPTDASIDSDGDGFTNLQEYLAGTNPLDRCPGSGSCRSLPILASIS